MRLLLIEDNQLNAQIFVRICTNLGFPDIVHCVDGFSGIQIAFEQHFDLIFIDFDLPDISGLQVGLSLARQMLLGNLPRTNLIAITAQSDKASQVEAQKLGFHAFLGKPSTETDVYQLIQHFGSGQKEIGVFSGERLEDLS